MINLHFIFLVSMFIFGLNFACDYEESEAFKQNGHYNLLWKLKFWSLKYIGEFWTRPLLTCPVCMASFWTTIAYAYYYFGNYNIIEWLVLVVVVAGFNRILKNFV